MGIKSVGPVQVGLHGADGSVGLAATDQLDEFVMLGQGHIFLAGWPASSRSVPRSPSIFIRVWRKVSRRRPVA